MREWSEEHGDFVQHDYDIEMAIFDSLLLDVRRAINQSPYGYELRSVIPQTRGAPIPLIVAGFLMIRPDMAAAKYDAKHPQLKHEGKRI